MIVGMGKVQDPGPGSRVDNPQDVEVTGDLPMSLTTFVGRERELDEIRSLFREGKRLVTLVGIGGIGKTRLALELGFSAGDLGWSKVYLVELASLANPDLVDAAVLESVGAGSSRSPLQVVVEYLREATALLVLDCCEHVLDAARHVAEVLLRRCPSVAILATSRSPLGIAGELVWPVPPLSMQKRSDSGETGASDSARLFADRASYVQPRFELSEDVAGAVEAIVRRVDGIPLAIELAAARVRVLSAEEIADGLDDHLRLLSGGHQSDPRHQTIRASLDWSHELLTDAERQLLARLSVFSGGFDLQAATAVCAGGAIVSGQMLDQIEGLVDKSLLAVERTEGATRFRMLDFVRQYAAERLAAAAEGDLLADRHRAYFRELAERADRELWALVPAGPLEETLRVAEAIGFEDDIRWCLWCLVHTAFSAGDLASARAHGERALAMMPGQDQLSRYCAVEVLCLLDASMGAADAARERAEADLEQSRQEKLRLGTGVLVHALGVAALAAGDLDRAEQWATSLYEHESEVCYLAWHAQEILVAVALARNDGAAAKIHVERLLAAAEPLRNRRARAAGHLGLARALLLEGDDERAESVTYDALKVLMDNRWRPRGVRGLSTPSMWSLRSPCSRDSMSAPPGSLLPPGRSGPRSASWHSRCLGSELSGTWPRPARHWATRVLKGRCRTAPGCLSRRPWPTPSGAGGSTRTPRTGGLA